MHPREYSCLNAVGEPEEGRLTVIGLNDGLTDLIKGQSLRQRPTVCDFNGTSWIVLVVPGIDLDTANAVGQDFSVAVWRSGTGELVGGEVGVVRGRDVVLVERERGIALVRVEVLRAAEGVRVDGFFLAEVENGRRQLSFSGVLRREILTADGLARERLAGVVWTCC